MSLRYENGWWVCEAGCFGKTRFDCVHQRTRKILGSGRALRDDEVVLELVESAQDRAERLCAEKNRAITERYSAAERYQQEYNFVVDLLRRIKASRIPPSAGCHGTGRQLRFMGSLLPADLQFW